MLIFITFSLLLFIILFIFNASVAINETADAVRLFLFVVLPSVFPFCVVGDFFARSGVLHRAGSLAAPLMRPLFGLSGACAFAVIIGIISSYPAAAKTSASLYRSGTITYNEAVALTAFTNNAGPLYIIGVVGASFLHSSHLGLIIWLCHISASLLTGVLLCAIYRRTLSHKHTAVTHTDIHPQTTLNKPSAFSLLSQCIADSALTMVPVAGAVIFFAAVCSVFTHNVNSPAYILSFAARFLLEMTAATKVAATAILPLPLLCALFNGICAWGGISVHAQVIYILSENGLPCGRYLLGKTVHTVLAVVITYFVCSCLL